MHKTIDRRQFIKLAGLGGGVVFASGLGGFSALAQAASRHGKKASGAEEDFYFVQLSDTHWGFSNPVINPDFAGTLQKALAQVNALSPAPDFIVFTGDLTQTTDDAALRRQRMSEFRDIIAALKVRDIRYLAGEHDAALDQGAAFKEFFGDTHYSFDHRGVHFIALDNVSDPAANIGADQLAWLGADLAKLDRQQAIVVLTHRPLFDLAPSWDWATPDAGKAIDLLMPFEHVTVFYGHIHQQHHHMTGHIAHHSAQGLMWPLPAPLSVPKKAPVAWDPAAPYQGLGFRQIESEHGVPTITELPVKA
ncbi:MAG: serine/threonine protein phosphatase [Hydrocarboniphaga sp.]|nr:metallophosphoesterase [Hydrocarboniphaga sp.]MDB5970797.1 serine/threonine protein phosphatase [Hydrocarboniphaga sp.]